MLCDQHLQYTFERVNCSLPFVHAMMCHGVARSGGNRCKFNGGGRHVFVWQRNSPDCCDSMGSWIWIGRNFAMHTHVVERHFAFVAGKIWRSILPRFDLVRVMANIQTSSGAPLAKYVICVAISNLRGPV